ncbi:MAG: hypothetical protein Q7R47_03545 [Candidatus Diapherotrites archaeon]|nr:hypothetical protein [Candidatus Diapherotrites archaeon]
MAKPRARTTPDIEITFKSHATRDRFLPQRTILRVKNVMYEDASGPQRPLSRRQLKEVLSSGDLSIFDKSQARALLYARKKGKKITSGEQTLDTKEHEQLKAKEEISERTFIEAEKTRAVEDIAQFFKHFSAWHDFRHELILRNIAKAPKPIAGQFGTAHSIMWPQLYRQHPDKKLKRNIRPVVFHWLMRVFRKISAGKKPTPIEYKKGFLDTLGGNLYRHESQRVNATEKEQILSAAFFGSLIDRLTEEQTDLLLRERDRNKINPKLFAMNGLPAEPNKRQVVNWLQKHSPFWKREETIRQMKKKGSFRGQGS